MKNKNPNTLEDHTVCYKPDIKVLEKRKKSIEEAKQMIDDLYENDYLPYEVSVLVRGSIRLQLEDIKEQIADVKKKGDK